MPKKEKENKKSPLKELLNKKFESDFCKMVDELDKNPYERIPTGSSELDEILSGGYPEGRLTEISGEEGTGKTTLFTHAVAEAQKKHKDKNVLYIDLEQAFDPTYAEKLGVDPSRLLFIQPSTLEETLDTIELAVSSGEVSMVVLDSVAQLTPEDELNGQTKDQTRGLTARLLNKHLRKILKPAAAMNVALLYINQLRVANMGISYGDPRETTGGKGMKFCPTLRIRLARESWIKKGDEVRGIRVKVSIPKHRNSLAYKTCSVDLMLGQGIVRENELLVKAEKLGIIKRNGAFFYFVGDDKPFAQGLEKATNLLQIDPTVRKRIEDGINKHKK